MNTAAVASLDRTTNGATASELKRQTKATAVAGHRGVAKAAAASLLGGEFDREEGMNRWNWDKEKRENMEGYGASWADHILRRVLWALLELQQ
jgi:hypothetical protein